jgi:hypothetical protein
MDELHEAEYAPEVCAECASSSGPCHASQVRRREEAASLGYGPDEAYEDDITGATPNNVEVCGCGHARPCDCPEDCIR